jgi:hypothetical protein
MKGALGLSRTRHRGAESGGCALGVVVDARNVYWIGGHGRTIEKASL